MGTPSYGFQNKFSTTLSSGITATDTTIPLTSLPTASEGTLIIEPDSSTGWEEIYYTSKTGSAVVCPSVALGRGQNGSTAASHSGGATVRMDTAAGMFNQIQDATILTGVHTNNSNYNFDFVASGCIWSGDSYGSTRAASMTSGVVYINGRRHTVAAVTARTFTASKDTYVDLLYSTTDNIATPVYTEVSNNAASPALAANSVRIAIIITAAGSIADAGSVNQGQESKVLPISSSLPYAVTDSLGNLICPRDPNRRILGYRQDTTGFTATSSTVAATGSLSCPVIVPTGRKVRVTAYCGQASHNNNDFIELSIWEGTVGSGTKLNHDLLGGTGNPFVALHPERVYTPTSTSITYNAGKRTGSATATYTGSATVPAYIKVELV